MIRFNGPLWFKHVTNPCVCDSVFLAVRTVLNHHIVFPSTLRVLRELCGEISGLIQGIVIAAGDSESRAIPASILLHPFHKTIDQEAGLLHGLVTERAEESPNFCECAFKSVVVPLAHDFL